MHQSARGCGGPACERLVPRRWRRQRALGTGTIEVTIRERRREPRRRRPTKSAIRSADGRRPHAAGARQQALPRACIHWLHSRTMAAVIGRVQRHAGVVHRPAAPPRRHHRASRAAPGDRVRSISKGASATTLAPTTSIRRHRRRRRRERSSTIKVRCAFRRSTTSSSRKARSTIRPAGAAGEIDEARAFVDVFVVADRRAGRACPPGVRRV